MSYMIWEYATLISLVIFVVCALLMLICGFTRNRYYHEHHKDELIKESKTTNSKNYLYFTNGETLRYIKKYVLCRTSLDKYVIVNYNEKYRNVAFFILCYTKSGHVIKVLRYSETMTGLSSKVIMVPKGTNNVNIVISEVDGQIINYNVIKPLSLKKIKANAVCMGFLVFSFLFVIRHVVFAFGVCGFDLLNPIEYLTFRGLMENVLETLTNYVLVGLSILVGIIAGCKARKVYIKKNKKNSNGGTIEYDFSE